MSIDKQEDLTSSRDDGQGASTEAKEQAQQVAGSAAEQRQHVAGVAQEHAKKITGEAKDQVRGLMDEASTQLDEQSRTQKTKLAETLRGFGEDLESMSSSDSKSTGPAQKLVQQAAHQAQDLAAHLEDREPQELLDDVRRFARQKPATFVLGALVAGVVVGRLTRGSKAAKEEDQSSTSNVRPTPESHPLTAPPVVGSADGLDATSLPVSHTASVTSGPATGGLR